VIVFSQKATQGDFSVIIEYVKAEKCCDCKKPIENGFLLLNKVFCRKCMVVLQELIAITVKNFEPIIKNK